MEKLTFSLKSELLLRSMQHISVYLTLNDPLLWLRRRLWCRLLTVALCACSVPVGGARLASGHIQGQNWPHTRKLHQLRVSGTMMSSRHHCTAAQWWRPSLLFIVQLWLSGLLWSAGGRSMYCTSTCSVFEANSRSGHSLFPPIDSFNSLLVSLMKSFCTVKTEKSDPIIFIEMSIIYVLWNSRFNDVAASLEVFGAAWSNGSNPPNHSTSVMLEK